MATHPDDLSPETSRLRREYVRSHTDQRRLVADPGFLPLVRARMAHLKDHGTHEVMTPEQFLERYPE